MEKSDYTLYTLCGANFLLPVGYHTIHAPTVTVKKISLMKQRKCYTAEEEVAKIETPASILI